MKKSIPLMVAVCVFGFGQAMADEIGTGRDRDIPDAVQPGASAINDYWRQFQAWLGLDAEE